MAITVDAALTGSNNSKTSGTSIAITIGAGGVAVGKSMYVGFASNPASGTYTCADSRGNTYKTLSEVTNGSGTSGVKCIVFVANLGLALESGDTITVTHPTLTARAVVSWGADGDEQSASFSDTGTGTNTTFTSASVSQRVANSLFVGAFGWESENTATTVWTPNITGSGATDTTTGGGDASNIRVALSIRVTSDSTSRTWGSVQAASRLYAYAVLSVAPKFKTIMPSGMQAVKRASFY